jgi:hypothetical protein
MRVELASELFPNPPSDLHVHAICTLAFDGRHRLIVQDDQSPDFRGWLGSMSQAIQNQWDVALRTSYLLEAHEPARRKMRVTAQGSADWSAAVPNLALADAAIYLGQPFRAVLEDWRSDRAFLNAVAQPEFRKALVDLERLGGLTFENGGGISNQTVKLRADGQGGPREASRIWAMFDSDALCPGMPSGQAVHAAQVCIDNAIAFHRLERRSIENYLPKDELRGWAFSRAKGIAERRRVFEAFLELSDDQRYHFNFKAGFHGDESRDDRANVGSLYDGLAPGARAALQTGFGAHIAEIFHSSVLDEASLRRDGSWTELDGMVRTLVELVR